jgi:hypothetical protein
MKRFYSHQLELKETNSISQKKILNLSAVVLVRQNLIHYSLKVRRVKAHLD